MSVFAVMLFVRSMNMAKKFIANMPAPRAGTAGVAAAFVMAMAVGCASTGTVQSALSGTAETVSVRITSATAGIIWLDGRDTGEEIEAGGRTTIRYASGGTAKIGLETADGSLFVLDIPVTAGMPSIAAFPELSPQDFQTTANGTSVTIAKYTGEGSKSVVIPASISGRSVTSIGNEAFYGCYGLKPEVRADIERRFGKKVF
jgi:hypothetical protein